MKTKALTIAFIVLSMTGGLAFARGIPKGFEQPFQAPVFFPTGANQPPNVIANSQPYTFNPFTGQIWRVAYGTAQAGLHDIGGGGVPGGKGVPGPIAGAGLPFLLAGAAAYLLRQRSLRQA